MKLVKMINSLRLENKNNWYYYQGIVDGKHIQVKGYNTWLQVFKINGIDHSGNMDISVKEFKEVLTNGFNYKG